jgi:acyl-CoA thioesterase FadM
MHKIADDLLNNSQDGDRCMVGLFKMLWVWLTYRRRGRIGPFDSAEIGARVMPWDLDLNFHMNNGRYFSIADIGRFDWWMRSGMWNTALTHGWRPVAGDANARFSGSLQLFQRYRLHTRLLGWNPKWFFVEHRYTRGERVMCTVLVRYLFIGDSGPRPTADILQLMNWEMPSPALPEWVMAWERAQNNLSAQLRAERAAWPLMK